MRGIDLSLIYPLRVRSLSVRKRSLLRNYASMQNSFEQCSTQTSSTAKRHEQFAKKRKGRRVLRFAPMVDVYEAYLPDDFTKEEFQALWFGQHDYENAKKEFTAAILAIMRGEGGLESADLLEDEDNLPQDHPIKKYCLRGCEKYFDLETRFGIRQLIAEKVLEFYRCYPQDPEALRLYSRALTAECSDLAYFHGMLNQLQCWGKLLQKYQQIREHVSRRAFTQSFFSQEEGKQSSCGVEVILDPSAQIGCRTLSPFEAV